MKHVFNVDLFSLRPLKLNSFQWLSLLFLIFTGLCCTKHDVLSDTLTPAQNMESKFFTHSGSLSPTISEVYRDIKLKMNEKQIGRFVENAGFVVWDKARVYPAPSLSNVVNNESSTDSIVVMPVAVENTQHINAALVAKIFNGGDSIVYSTHFKNDFQNIDSTAQTDYGVSARALYILGMAQLDAEVFNHRQFIIQSNEPEFGLPSTEGGEGTSIAVITMLEQYCEYRFTYSSAVVTPPVEIYTYTAACGSAITLPSAAFFQSLDESYGMVLFSSTPIAEGGGGPVSPYSLLFSNFYQSLDQVHKDFLDNPENIEFYHGFIEYLELHQYSQQAQDHIEWCIAHLLENTTLMPAFPDFYQQYLNDFPSLFFLTQAEIDFLKDYPHLLSRVYYYLNTFQLNAEQKLQYHVNKLMTDQAYISYNMAYANDPLRKNLWFSDGYYLQDYGGVVFGEWAINYLMAHEELSFILFHSSFLTSQYFSGFYHSLSSSQQLWWDSFNNEAIKEYLIDFLKLENFSTRADYLVKDLIDWLSINNTISLIELQYFLSIPEAGDGFYTQSYWEDPNTILQQINLPSLQQFTQHFPKKVVSAGITFMPSKEVYEMVGGALGNKYDQPNYKNACAIRGSWAFNQIKVGTTYPFRLNAGIDTEMGANNLSYIVNAKSFNAYMHKKFGNSSHSLNATQINGNRTNLNNFFKNLRNQNIHGIYTLVTSGGTYSGHVDLMTFGDCLGGYALPENISNIEKIEIWQLQ